VVEDRPIKDRPDKNTIRYI